MLKLMGTEDARDQGQALIDGTGTQLYLRSVPREEVTTVTEALFEFYQDNCKPSESMGYFHRRMGMQALIDYLKQNPKTAHLMKKTYKPLITFQ